ncbi:MAG: hypothetical protein WCJ57_03235 [Candidatus Falkowbacteria bacterium]
MDNEVDVTTLDPSLETRVIKAALPKKLGSFISVIINVPAPRDENANTGDKHMKLVLEHYLRVDYSSKVAQLFHVPEHYVRYDFSIPSENRSAISRHFYVSRESLGKKILANAEVLRNSDGSISVNFIEINSVVPPAWTMSMRPLKDGELENQTLFLIAKTDKCLEFVPVVRRS